MKYAGNINILDDDGNLVFERELDADEIIEQLLAAISSDAEQIEELTPPPSATDKPRVARGRPTTKHIPGAKECCGSLGKRHLKGCGEIIPQNIKNRRTVDNRRAFSEPTFNIVKEMLDDRSVDEVASEKGLELDEVRRCNLADDYRDYLTLA